MEEPDDRDYIVLTQRPNYKSEAAWINEAERPGIIEANRLRFLREYQHKAVQSIQEAVKEGKDRFLFEMATVQALLGHSSSELTRDTYIRSVPADARREITEVEKLIGPKWTQVKTWPEMRSTLIN